MAIKDPDLEMEKVTKTIPNTEWGSYRKLAEESVARERRLWRIIYDLMDIKTINIAEELRRERAEREIKDVRREQR